MRHAFPLTPAATPVVTPEPPAPAAVPAPTETVAPVKLPDLEPELPAKPGLAAYEELLTLQEQREEMRDDLDDLNQEIATLGVERDALGASVLPTCPPAPRHCVTVFWTA